MRATGKILAALIYVRILSGHFYVLGSLDIMVCSIYLIGILKMKIFKYAAVALFASLPVSCAVGDRADKVFGREITVEAEYIPVNELLEINNIVKLDDYLILQNESEGVEDFFFVYSYPEIEFLYSFAKRGRGPNEYFLPAVIKNTPGNILGFRDHATDNIAFYDITDSGATLMRTIPFKSEDSFRFFWEINYVSDSVILTKHQGYKTGATESWNVDRCEVVDSLPNTFEKLRHRLGKSYYTIFDDYFLVAGGGRFAQAYLMIDRIEFGSIDDNGRMSIVSSVGMDTAPDFYLYRRNETTEFNVDRNIVYYENLVAGDEYVYALYSGDRLDDTEKNHSSEIEIYDWEGTPCELLHLDVPVAWFTVDEENRTIYAVSPSVPEENILKYSF